MAVIAPIVSRQRIFACKAETTTGTAESLTSAEAAYNAYDVEIVPEYTNTPRPGQSSHSPLPSIPGPASGRIRLKTDLCGSGGASSPSPAYNSTLLAACGWAVSSNIWKPVTGSSSYTTLTAASYVDGLKATLAGCVGNFTLTGEYGKQAVWDWELLGVWQDPADVSLLTPTYPTVNPPRVASATFTIGGDAYRIGSFSLACNNEMYLREDISKAQGYLAACIVNRALTFTCSVEATLLATKNWYSHHAAGTEAAISLAIGSSSGNTITIAIPKAQLSQAPVWEDAGGTLKHQLTFQCNRSAAAGDDEVSITHS